MKKNTMLCVDVKTVLQNDSILHIGKPYVGVLRQDGEDHLQFEETATSPNVGKRNPHVFKGKYITITRRYDGYYRFNFREVNVGHDFNTFAFAFGVANELIKALTRLVNKDGSK